MSSGALAIFVKTPGHSPLKTRLAAGIGREASLNWYAAAVQATHAVVSTFAAASGVAAYWAVAEPCALNDPQWASLPCIAQGEGGLGERMARVHAALVARHGRAVLIGADAPQLSPDDLHATNGWLANDAPRLSLGPARDGGFWLVGANRGLPLGAWTAVSYSRSDTAKHFKTVMTAAILAKQDDWQILRTLVDVDDAGDLPALAMALETLKDALPAQIALLTLTHSVTALDHLSGVRLA